MITELFGGITGAALWAAQCVKARRIVPPPPALTHCDKARQHVHKTVRYSGNQYLDIWRSECDHPHIEDVGDKWTFCEDVPHPVMVFIPGGAWMIGHRRPQGYALMSHMVERGWICLAIDYRTSPRYRWPKHLDDVKAAIKWARTHVAEHGGDPDFITVAGASAGGHLAALAGLAWDHPGPDIRPDAVVSLYGCYDWRNFGVAGRFLEALIVGKRRDEHPDIFRNASPIGWVRPDAPPFLVVHGAADRLLPVRGARRFYDKLSAVSRSEVRYHEIAGAGHAFDLVHARHAASAVAQIGSFLADVHRRRNARLVS